MTVTDTNHDEALRPRFLGLATDTKPANTMVGASFLETDTGVDFVYDGAAWVNVALVKVVQTAPVIVTEVLATDTLLDEVLLELKINNAQLALITGSEITGEDV